MDWNVQVDVKSAKACDSALSQPDSHPAFGYGRDCGREEFIWTICGIRGVSGQLLADQADAFAVDEQNEIRYGETCEGLPNDIDQLPA